MEMKSYMLENNYTIFLETENCGTIRAKFPVGRPYENTTADFVIARKDVLYNEDDRTPICELGTLYDDLYRRDFTINAIAYSKEEDLYYDFFNGFDDLQNRILKCTFSPDKSFSDDPLRILRALRFSITKGFNIDKDTYDKICFYLPHIKVKVSKERIREELNKCFQSNTIKTLEIFRNLDDISEGNFTKTVLDGIFLNSNIIYKK